MALAGLLSGILPTLPPLLGRPGLLPPADPGVEFGPEAGDILAPGFLCIFPPLIGRLEPAELGGVYAFGGEPGAEGGMEGVGVAGGVSLGAAGGELICSTGSSVAVVVGGSAVAGGTSSSSPSELKRVCRGEASLPSAVTSSTGLE